MVIYGDVRKSRRNKSRRGTSVSNDSYPLRKFTKQPAVITEINQKWRNTLKHEFATGCCKSLGRPVPKRRGAGEGDANLPIRPFMSASWILRLEWIYGSAQCIVASEIYRHSLCDCFEIYFDTCCMVWTRWYRHTRPLSENAREELGCKKCALLLLSIDVAVVLVILLRWRTCNKWLSNWVLPREFLVNRPLGGLQAPFFALGDNLMALNERFLIDEKFLGPSFEFGFVETSGGKFTFFFPRLFPASTICIMLKFKLYDTKV